MSVLAAMDDSSPKALKHRYERLGFSQAKAAKELGISRNTLRRFENGEAVSKSTARSIEAGIEAMEASRQRSTESADEQSLSSPREAVDLIIGHGTPSLMVRAMQEFIDSLSTEAEKWTAVRTFAHIVVTLERRDATT